jgi:hypothetical protein
MDALGLIEIAGDARLTIGAHAHHLPPSWRTLYELTNMCPSRR